MGVRLRQAKKAYSQGAFSSPQSPHLLAPFLTLCCLLPAPPLQGPISLLPQILLLHRHSHLSSSNPGFHEWTMSSALQVGCLAVTRRFYKVFPARGLHGGKSTYRPGSSGAGLADPSRLPGPRAWPSPCPLSSEKGERRLWREELLSSLTHRNPRSQGQDQNSGIVCYSH